MKKLFTWLSPLLLLAGCKNDNTKIVDAIFIDSLISHYSYPAIVKSTEDELQFWKARIDPKLPGIVNESKYAGMLIARFHLLGDVKDIRSADSTLRKADTLFNHKEPGPSFSLVGYAILQHRFKEADEYLHKAKAIGIKKYESLALSVDVDFELGRYSNAALQLRQMQPSGDYGYYFRLSKQEHYNGALDSSIKAMLHAAELVAGSPYLEQVTLSNVADLYIHAGDLQQAGKYYMQCVRMNAADFHSITGLGWIALVHDKNDSLAERIFRFVASKNQLPDPLFKLVQVAAAKGDSVLQLQYAQQFEKRATDSLYGNMYNKYLIELYTGILNNPQKAVALAQKELDNRATPQTYAWYAWSLVTAGNKAEAYKVYEQHVSGKPLEGLELYQMGKLMQALDKGYNAQQFFKEAYKNKYDLSPGIVKDIEKVL